MKWLVRGVALLITCSIYTLLQYANFLFLGGIGAGLLTIALFGLGVWFIPNRIIRRMEEKKSAPPPPPPRETNTRRETLYNFTVDGQSICIPESQLASFQEAQERIQAEQADALPPEPEPEPAPAADLKPEPKRRPIPSFDKVGYQLGIVVLATLALLSFIGSASSRSDLEKMEDTIEELEYELGNSYEEGYSSGRSEGFDEGYTAGVGDYAPEVGFFRQNACIVTTSGSKYHHWGCYHIAGRDFNILNTALAESYGYEPCQDCWEDGLLIDWNG